MKRRLSSVLVAALVTGTLAVSACGDDSDSGTPDDSGGSATGGSSGASGSKTGGSSSGGTSSAGNSSAGKAGSATAVGGAGPLGDGGATGLAGAPGAAGADSSAAGNAGAGGAGEPALVYACGSATLIQKKCSALVAANCPDATVCPDCVALATADREAFQTDPPCETCNAKWDAFDQCQVDAFESGNLAYGVECFDGYGADGTDNCYPFLDDAIACEGYVGSDVNPHECPATWPPQ